jgi:hypothetical protein
MNKRNIIQDLHYIDADTGEIIETIQMRIFQISDGKGNWIVVRQYELSQESKLNPGFGKSPQNDDAFPDGRQNY